MIPVSKTLLTGRSCKPFGLTSLYCLVPQNSFWLRELIKTPDRLNVLKIHFQNFVQLIENKK